jgi:hypothetical protein
MALPFSSLLLGGVVFPGDVPADGTVHVGCGGMFVDGCCSKCHFTPELGLLADGDIPLTKNVRPLGQDKCICGFPDGYCVCHLH